MTAPLDYQQLYSNEKASHDSLKTQFEDLQTKYDDVESNLRKRIQSNAQMAQDVDDGYVENRVLEGQVAELSESNRIIGISLKKSEQICTSANRRVGELEQELLRTQGLLRTSSDSLSNAKSAASASEKLIKSLRDNYTQWRKLEDKLRQEIEEETSRADKAQAELESLQESALAERDAEREDFEAQLSEQITEIEQECKAQLAAMDDIISTKNQHIEELEGQLSDANRGRKSGHMPTTGNSSLNSPLGSPNSLPNHPSLASELANSLNGSLDEEIDDSATNFDNSPIVSIQVTPIAPNQLAVNVRPQFTTVPPFTTIQVAPIAPLQPALKVVPPPTLNQVAVVGNTPISPNQPTVNVPSTVATISQGPVITIDNTPIPPNHPTVDVLSPATTLTHAPINGTDNTPVVPDQPTSSLSSVATIDESSVTIFDNTPISGENQPLSQGPIVTTITFAPILPELVTITPVTSFQDAFRDPFLYMLAVLIILGLHIPDYAHLVANREAWLSANESTRQLVKSLGDTPSSIFGAIATHVLDLLLRAISKITIRKVGSCGLDGMHYTSQSVFNVNPKLYG